MEDQRPPKRMKSEAPPEAASVDILCTVDEWLNHPSYTGAHLHQHPLVLSVLVDDHPRVAASLPGLLAVAAMVGERAAISFMQLHRVFGLRFRCPEQLPPLEVFGQVCRLVLDKAQLRGLTDREALYWLLAKPWEQPSSFNERPSLHSYIEKHFHGNVPYFLRHVLERATPGSGARTMTRVQCTPEYPLQHTVLFQQRVEVDPVKLHGHPLSRSATHTHTHTHDHPPQHRACRYMFLLSRAVFPERAFNLLPALHGATFDHNTGLAAVWHTRARDTPASNPSTGLYPTQTGGLETNHADVVLHTVPLLHVCSERSPLSCRDAVGPCPRYLKPACTAYVPPSESPTPMRDTTGPTPPSHPVANTFPPPPLRAVVDAPPSRHPGRGLPPVPTARAHTHTHTHTGRTVHCRPCPARHPLRIQRVDAPGRGTVQGVCVCVSMHG
jgi:hypothetical protein